MAIIDKIIKDVQEYNELVDQDLTKEQIDKILEDDVIDALYGYLRDDIGLDPSASRLVIDIIAAEAIEKFHNRSK